MRLARKTKDGSYRYSNGEEVKGKRILTDVFFLVGIGMISILFYVLGAIKFQYLVLNVTKLNWISWLSTNFIHSSFTHLLGNMMLYALSVSLLYAFLVNKRRTFYWIVLMLLFILPAFTLISTILFRIAGIYPQDMIFNVGFSGIVSGFIGSLALPLSSEIKKFTNISIKNSALILFCVSMIGAVITLKSWILVGIIALLLMTLISLASREFRWEKEKAGNLRRNFKDLFILTVSLCLMLVIVYYLIPSEIWTPTGRVNIFAHYLGFVFGFFVPFVVEYVLLKD